MNAAIAASIVPYSTSAQAAVLLAAAIAAVSLLYLPGAHGRQESRTWAATGAPLSVVALIRALP